MAYWLHRISHEAEVSYPLLEKGYLSIGFSDFAYERFLSTYKSLEKQPCGDWTNGEDFLKSQMEDWPNCKYSLFRFFQMKAGDKVVVPQSYGFSVYEISNDEILLPSQLNIENLKNWHGVEIALNDFTDPFLYRIDCQNPEEDYYDLGFFRKVRLVEQNISRYDYADNDLSKRLKARQTTLDISDLEKSIQNAIEAKRADKPINLYNSIIEKSAGDWLNIVKEKLEDTKFESLVESYFKKLGAATFIPSKSGQEKNGFSDVDVVATFEPLKLIINVQVKKYDGTANEWAAVQMRDYADMMKAKDPDYTNLYWIISTADDFSEECKNLACDNNIRLINGIEFMKMLISSGIRNIEI